MPNLQRRSGADPDAAMIELVRAGQTDAYGELFERHVGAAYSQARQLCRNRAEIDDLVAESFMNMLVKLREGRGPDGCFRAYLLTAMRHAAYSKTRESNRLCLYEDFNTESGADADAIAVPFADPIIAGVESLLAAKAFNGLPERWRRALTYTVLDGMDPAQMAPLLGLTRNGAAALAYRARRALRVRYLQAHLSDSEVAKRCRATFPKLGARAYDIASGDAPPSILTNAHRKQVDAHLKTCARCRRCVHELAALSPRVRLNVTITRRPCQRRGPLPPRRHS